MADKITKTTILPSGERVIQTGAASTRRKQPKPMTPEESTVVRQAKRSRKRWETENPDRLTTAASLSPTGMSVGQVYSEMGWKDSGVGPKHYDEQLPGMSDPNAAPRPPRWSELTDEQRSHVHRGLSMRGTSIDQMTSDFGAQLDQGFMRAHKHKTDEPYAQRFYSTGEERQNLDESARHLGIPQVVHATVHAIVSPNTKFKTAHSYPEERAATAAVQWSKEGRDPQDLNSANYRASKDPEHDAPSRVSLGLTARPANMRKAAHVMNQVRAGVPLAETTGPTGLSVFGESAPKTGPYANTWSDTHPQYFVSDVHSGGGGMVPHLSADKPKILDVSGEQRLSTSGKPKIDKSEREKAIEKVPYFHSASDEAARRATTVRGLGSLREAQATQWGEEQIQRGGKHGRSESAAYPGRKGHFDDGAQGKLF